MKDEIFHLDFNFETILAESKINLKGASWFDHIFYFINDSKNAVLKTHYPYDQQYLEYISSLGVSSTKTVFKGSSKPWWGNYTDLELSKKLNSKIEMSQLGVEKKWIPIPTIIDSSRVSELSFPIIAREEWGFSGKGLYTFNEKENLKLPKGRYVLSSKVNKERDFGITFDLCENSYFVVENFIDESGQFKGGMVISNDDFKKIIGPKNSSILKEIRETLVAMGARESFQIDTFTYTEGFHPFVEVNYRKTMGLMVKALEKFFKDKYTAWLIVTNKSKTTFDEAREKLNEISNEEITFKILSPVERFISIGVSSSNLEKLNNSIPKLEKLFC